MKRYFDKFNFVEPKISEYVRDNVTVAKEVEGDKSFWCMRVGGKQWMTYSYEFPTIECQTFSHYYFAEGHCILTGLGFGIREEWLLNKKEVKKITVIEKNKEVIEYHQYKKSSFLDHIELVHGDAQTYKGKCDTLLLDHFENPDEFEINILKSVKRVSLNIDCNLLWFWPIEWFLSNGKNLDAEEIFQKYENLRLGYGLHKLPSLSESEIFKLVATYHAMRMSEEDRLELFGVD